MRKPQPTKPLAYALLPLFSALALTLILALPASHSLALPVYDAANHFQNILQVSKAIIQINYQIAQLETMLRNLERFEDPSWRDLTDHLLYLGELSLQGESLSYARENLFELYRHHYPGFSPLAEGVFEETYSTWTNVALDTFGATLDSASGQAEDYLDTQEQLAELRTLADSSSGHLQALNTSNIYFGTVLNFEANQEATARWLLDEAQEEFHTYSGEEGFTGIPPQWPYPYSTPGAAP